MRMSSPTNLKDEEEVIQFLEDNFAELNSYKKTEQILKNVTKRKHDIKEKLGTCKQQTHDGLNKTKDSVHKLSNHLEALAQKQITAISDGTSFIYNDAKSLAESTGNLADDIEELQKLQIYLGWIIQINRFSQEIENQLARNAIGNAVDLFRNMNNVYDRFKGSNCSNLLKFIQESSIHWFKVLSEIILKGFNIVLDTFKWPFQTGISAPAFGQSEETMHLFQRLVKFVLNIDSLHRSGDSECLLLTKSLAKPLERRFHFHFYGKRQTNNLEKPDWFFTQTLNWIRDHTPFIEDTVQALVDRQLEDTHNVKEEFIRLLVQLVIDKMKDSLPKVIDNEDLFAHWIDETLLFEKELNLSYGYKDENTNAVKVLTERVYLDRWLALEQKYFNEKVEKLLESKSAWKAKYEEMGDVTESKVPEVVEEFMLQLSAMIERFEEIPSLISRLKFIDLQLALCLQFIEHLKDTANVESSQPLHDCFCSVLNGVQFMQNVLDDWNEKTIYVRLSYARHMVQPVTETANSENHTDSNSERESSSTETSYHSTFDGVIETLKKFEAELISAIVSELKAKSAKHLKPYQNARWHCMRNLHELVEPVLSNACCPLMQWIRDQLSLLQGLLCPSAFNSVWPLFARGLDNLIFESVILSNHFNGGGAAQLNFDVTKNLYILFGEFTLKPEVYFKRTNEGLKLLNLMPGSAVLMKELMTSYERSRGNAQVEIETEIRKAIIDIGASDISIENSRIILNSRIDWPKA